MVEHERPGASVDSQDAFTRHVVPEIPVLHRVARSLVGRHADAEDLVQDTLLRAYRSIDSFDGTHPRAWLLTIMRNAEINRTRRRRPGLLRDPDQALRHLTGTATSAYDPEQVVVGQAFDEMVATALDQMPPLYRQVVELVDLQGLTYAEAAQTLGLPVGTVTSRLHRGRRLIRDQVVAAGLVRKRGRR